MVRAADPWGYRVRGWTRERDDDRPRARGRGATPAGRPSPAVLLLAHTGRDDAREVARGFVKALTGHGMLVRLLADEAADLGLRPDEFDPPLELAETDAGAGHDCELALVIGGDGTILRAAEITHDSGGTPVLGVNLGHVGFLAEAEYDDIDSTIEAIVDCRYTAEDRMTLDVSVHRDGEVVFRTFALNEASVEKAARAADARGRRRDRRPPALALGLRRRRLRHADRLDGLQLQRRRARSCGPRSRRC